MTAEGHPDSKWFTPAEHWYAKSEGLVLQLCSVGAPGKKPPAVLGVHPDYAVTRFHHPDQHLADQSALVHHLCRPWQLHKMLGSVMAINLSHELAGSPSARTALRIGAANARSLSPGSSTAKVALEAMRTLH
jgi:hypothetical protein